MHLNEVDMSSKGGVDEAWSSDDDVETPLQCDQNGCDVEMRHTGGQLVRKFSHKHKILNRINSLRGWPTGKNDTEGGMVAGLSIRAIKDYIEADDVSGLTVFLQNRHVQIDETDEDGWSGLFYAVDKGNHELVKLLVDHGSDLNQEDGDHCSPLHYAARRGQIDICSTLVKAGCQIDNRDGSVWTPFLWACYSGHTGVAELLMNHGADVNSHGVHHCSGLVWAAGRGHFDTVQLLLDRGARVDSGDKYGTTGLIWAARKGHKDIVEVLLKAQSQVDTTGMYSWTPLLVAVRGNYPTIVSKVLEHSPNVNAVDQDGLTALAVACKEGFTDIAYQLMSAGAYVNLQDRGGDTNLILACKGGHKSIVEALLRRYADLDTKGKDNKTCLYWAVEKNHPHIVKVLLNSNPDLEVTTSEGDTALLRAVKNRNTEIVQLLLEKKAKLTATDKRGDTALHVAMRARSKTIVELLLRNPKNSQLLHKPNRAGETPYNIDLASHKSIIGQVFGGRKLNTNEDAENMLGYDLYGSALADILTEPSLSMPISVGLYAKWGSGKSFLLRKLREEMKNFVRDWVDPSFHFSYLLLIVIIHIATLLGFFSWIICFYMPQMIETTNSFVVMTIVFFVTIGLCYLLMLSIWQATFKSDWYTLYNIHVKLAQMFNDLKLLVSVVFCHPPGPHNAQSTDQAQPLKLFFTDNTKVNTSAEGENCVIQMIGSLYDNIEESYGTVTTRLYRAFRPTPVKSTSPIRLRKICCIPYVVLYLFFYILLLAEIILIIMSAKGINPTTSDNEGGTSTVEPMQNRTITTQNELLETTDLEQYVLGVLIALSVILGVIVISNCYSFGQVVKALIFSQRTHLQRAVAKHDIVASEGFVQAVKKEVNLLQEMIKSLDAFSCQQSRLIVVVDGLDSVQQPKVLEVLDTVHSLFSEKGNFIIVLAIDPHIITKAIELNLNKVFMETSIAGGAYLRNMVHLPFFLQNAGLRKVNAAKEIAKTLKAKLIHSSSWIESDNIQTDRRTSMDSEIAGAWRNLDLTNNKIRKKHLTGHLESTANSIASNLNKISSTGGPLELTKMLLTDDYFSDVNPRTMRRLMNIIYVMGKLLKAFHIDFNWHHLASWANITEQWPYRTSWIILYCDEHEDNLEDSVPLRTIYEKIKSIIPTQKELEPMLEMDRDEKKLDVYLSYHKKSLTLATLKVFLPFSINLDPYIKKVIKEEVQNMEELGLPGLSSYSPASKSFVQSPLYNMNPNVPSKAPLTRRQAAGLSQKYGATPYTSYPQVLPTYPPTIASAIPHMKPGVGGMGGSMPGMHPSMMMPYATYPYQNYGESLNNSLSSFTVRPTLPAELQGCLLSAFTVEMVSLLIRSTEGINQGMVDQYCTTIANNNVNGRVLLYCQVDELKNVVNMNFGDWELFKLSITALRDDETNSRNNGAWRRDEETKQDAHDSTHERETIRHVREDSGRRNQSSVEKQVCMEEATVAGMLSTLNEEAQEEILQEELSNLKEQAAISNCGSTDNLRKGSLETEYLFYSELLPNSQNIDIVSDESIERGRSVRELTRQITFSNNPSRKNSYKDVSSEIDSVLSIPTSPAIAPPVTSSSSTSASIPSVASSSSIKSPSSKPLKKKLNLADRAMTVTNVLGGITKPSTLKLEEEDPYAWLSHGAQTAPASPRLHRTRSQSEGPAEGDSDPGHRDSMISIFHRSVRRTKTRRSKTESETDSLVSPDKKDNDTQDKMDRIKRKLKRAMTQNEHGSIPIVHRAKPNQEEYDDFQASRAASPESSNLDSDESCSSPEQRTVTRRPPLDQARGPPVHTLFQKEDSVPSVTEEESLMTTVLPDGSVMSSPESSSKKLTRQHEVNQQCSQSK